MNLRTGRRARRLVLAVLAVLLPAGPALTQTLAQLQTPAFAADQAAQGAALYAQHCAVCHGPDLNGGPFGPALAGEAFQARWGGAPLDELFDYLRASMPPAAPGGLDAAGYAALLAHQLEANGAAAGDAALPGDAMLLAGFAFPGEAAPDGDAFVRTFASLSSRARVPDWPAPPDRMAGLRAVDDSVLADPPAADWPAWRRGHRGHGFSPLARITPENAGSLRLAWSAALPGGPTTGEPLVRDGVLFVFGYGDEVLALDAASGARLWRYARHLPENQALEPKRNIALYGERLYVATSDLHIVALDARTGRPVWDRAITDRQGFRITGGPLVADGVVMQGLVGGRTPGGAQIVGMDAETGERLWAFNTIPAPGQPDGDTWNGLPQEARSGGSVWVAGTYDSESGLALFGPAPTYDTGPMRFREEGENNDALYTDATIALEPRTGRLVWFYQHMKNDQLDMDWAFERTVAELSINGETRRVIVTGGKEGLFDILDADRGEYLSTFDMGMQDFVTAIDPVTGEKTVDDSMMPGGRDDVIRLCPYAGGGRNWIPTAFDPRRGALYVAAQDVCMDIVPAPGGFMTTGINMEIAPRPDSDGRFGLIQALDVATGETLWRARQRAPQTTGVLATGGGVLFAGALDRDVTAYDAATGDKLWSAGLPDTPNGSPISFEADGRQYVAFVTGHGSPVTSAFTSLAPEIVIPSTRGAGVYVFALPE